MSANKDRKARWYSVACAGLAVVVCITAICGGGAFLWIRENGQFSKSLILDSDSKLNHPTPTIDESLKNVEVVTQYEIGSDRNEELQDFLDTKIIWDTPALDL